MKTKRTSKKSPVVAAVLQADELRAVTGGIPGRDRMHDFMASQAMRDSPALRIRLKLG